MLILSTAAVFTLAGRTIWAMRRYPLGNITPTSDSDAPTVSVCIAARNETHALAQCLERILKSDYTKLEVLVLDDSSNDDTSLIIKSFANAGVRFIPGKSLPVGWLGKNHAYKTLSDEASGDLLLYIDVDTGITPTSISQLVGVFTGSRLAMLSVLPRREDSQRFSALAGTMRYYWELLLGTRLSPPAASAIWMVDADTTKTAGIGLENYSMSVRPERHMARQLHKLSNYRYVIGTRELGISYEKHVGSQHETALRLYYPMTGRTVVSWLACTMFLLLLVAPLAVLAVSSWHTLIVMWASVLTISTTLTFGLFVYKTYGGSARFMRVILGPLLVLQELCLLTLSYVRYRQKAVTWKGRPVTAQSQNTDSLEVGE